MAAPRSSVGTSGTSRELVQATGNNSAMTTYTCPVCGWSDLTEPPRSPSGGGSYEICWSCGFEYGVTDDDLGHSYEQWREQWIKKGMRWDEGEPPEGWDPEEQLRRLQARPQDWS